MVVQIIKKKSIGEKKQNVGQNMIMKIKMAAKHEFFIAQSIIMQIVAIF
jgi:hypothetical protein